MRSIPVERMKAGPGTLRAFIFENDKIGLAPALYYELDIPLAPFDSGLPGDARSVPKAFRLHFLPLPRKDWRTLEGSLFQLEARDGSIYLGNAHNPVDVRLLTFRDREKRRFGIILHLFCDFEHEGVGRSAHVKLITDVEFTGLGIVDWMLKGAKDKAARARRLLKEHAAPEAYAERFDPKAGFAPAE